MKNNNRITYYDPPGEIDLTNLKKRINKITNPKENEAIKALMEMEISFSDLGGSQDKKYKYYLRKKL